jgi:ACS family tartrate transporter-like MFS transporter
VQHSATSLATDADPRVLTKIGRRLIPFMVLLYVLAYLDRINLSFAAESMRADLKLDEAVYGLGSGIFFVGYFLFEVPSNLILQRVGARRWIARIMITWGVVASAMMFVRGRWSFFGLRFVLGLAEAGFFPGMLLYLTYWFPSRFRARTIAMFFTATAIAGVVGAPASGMLLDLDGRLGLHGWQWLFLIEGVPSIVFGVLVWFLLPDGPNEARWLSADERAEVIALLEPDRSQPAVTSTPADSSAVNASALMDDPSADDGEHYALSAALCDGRLWLLSAIYFLLTIGLYGFGYWMPTLVKSVSTLTNRQLGVVAAIPYAGATVAMVLWGRHSDRTRERRWHAAASALAAAAGFAAAPFCQTPATMLAALSLAAVGVWALVPPFWAMPSAFLRGTAAAGGIAAINSVGNLGGFLGPYLFGLIKRHSQTYTPSLIMVATAMVMCAGLVLFVRVSPAPTLTRPIRMPASVLRDT